ncbi:DNA-directed RNA polymerase subunit omega [Sulfurovum sp. enrichment culture clone C5]|uniref:DNA-directed RNA polymerase subunit omega n=1 Tax=Sulfurovum sp. enrichment culture clone C5 TaxID=497650 RepID=A0A0S4XP16_9BACT|nr:DNA-directed RNA polymerase subunit omega [Sulfurovum sp. enrichment culture clone C5]
MIRLEQVAAKALEKVGFDRYLLACAVSKRAIELAAGAQPKIDMNVKKMKNTDIALLEIAEGKITVTMES